MTEQKLTKQNYDSLIGDFHKYYNDPKQDKTIVDKASEGILDLYPAGQTKSNPDGVSRQEILHHLWNLAVQYHREESINPFKDFDYKITIEPEPENRFDANAVAIHLYDDKDKKHHLGYIPKRIAKVVKDNLYMVHKLQILKIKEKVFGKYFSVKVRIFYGKQIGTAHTNSLIASRFTNLLE